MFIQDVLVFESLPRSLWNSFFLDRLFLVLLSCSMWRLRLSIDSLLEVVSSSLTGVAVPFLFTVVRRFCKPCSEFSEWDIFRTHGGFGSDGDGELRDLLNE